MPQLLGAMFNARPTVHTVRMMFSEHGFNSELPSALAHFTALTYANYHARTRLCVKIRFYNNAIPHLQLKPLCIMPHRELQLDRVDVDADWPIHRLTSLRTLRMLAPWGRHQEAPQWSLPASLWQPPLLQTLELRADAGDSEESLPGDIPATAKLQSLELCLPNLKHLPDAIGRLTDLTRLHIGGTALEELPDSLTQLSSLRYFFIDSYFGDQLVMRDGLTALEHLYVGLPGEMPSNNHDLGSLARFPNLQSLCIGGFSPDCIQFGAQTRLTSIEIIRCEGLGELPASLGNLCQLQQLKLDYNEDLEQFPEEASRLTALSALTITNCGLLDFQSIAPLTSLRRLELTRNYIDGEVVDPPLESFTLLEDLKIVDRTVELPAGMTGLTNLTMFSLDATNIRPSPRFKPHPTAPQAVSERG
jgi:internalin A